MAAVAGGSTGVAAGQFLAVVGEDGAAMKKLSTEARKDIEVFLERGVFLEMKVKSKPGWRSNDKSLTEFGLEDPNKTSNPDFRE